MTIYVQLTYYYNKRFPESVSILSNKNYLQSIKYESSTGFVKKLGSNKMVDKLTPSAVRGIAELSVLFVDIFLK